MKNRLLVLLYALFFLSARGQASVTEKPVSSCEHPKGTFTLYWGYNRDYFSKSNIHFSGPDYNFTLYGLTASDRPAPFAFNTYFDPQRMWVPQYNYRFGYFVKDNLCLSLGMDHMKYVVDNYQDAKMTGTVSSNASEQFKGIYNNQRVNISPDLLTFEHTNGFNLLSLDADFFKPVLALMQKKINLSLCAGIGAGGLIPKTDVRVFGDGLDNKFHLAGYSASAKLGVRINLFKRFFVSAKTRGGFASLPSVLIKNESPQRASHSLWYAENILVFGVYFRLGNR